MLHPECIGFLLQEGPPHKCALIFADNSGIDIILGVFPFVRELLSRGTEVSAFPCELWSFGNCWKCHCPPAGHFSAKVGIIQAPGTPEADCVTSPGPFPQVILACNSGPALNDVTYSESLIVTERIAAMDPVIQ